MKTNLSAAPGEAGMLRSRVSRRPPSICGRMTRSGKGFITTS